MKGEKKEEMKQEKLLKAFNGSAKLNSVMSPGTTEDSGYRTVEMTHDSRSRGEPHMRTAECRRAGAFPWRKPDIRSRQAEGVVHW